MLIVKALGHLVCNAYAAGATTVKIHADCLPTDPVYTIAVEDDGPGIAPDILQQLRSGEGGSGWEILRKVTFPQLDAHFTITSPHQTDTGKGTLVMIFIPVIAQTGDEPDSGSVRKADSGPLPAAHSITPPAGLPAIDRPITSGMAFEPVLASAATCFGATTGILLKFKK